MHPLLVAADANRGSEEFGETRLGEEFFAGAIGDDAAGMHEDDALDFGQDVAQVVGDEHQASSLTRQTTKGFAEFALGGKVERVGRLVEQELLGTVNQGTRDDDAALFSRGHLADQLFGEVGGFHPLKSLPGTFPHLLCHVEIGPKG